MSRRNLADAGYEPTDEDLVGLSREAFAGVRETNERALGELRDRIASRSAAVLAALEQAPPQAGEAEQDDS